MVCLELNRFSVFVGRWLEPCEFWTFWGHSPEILVWLWLACDSLPDHGGKGHPGTLMLSSQVAECCFQALSRAYLLQMLCSTAQPQQDQQRHVQGFRMKSCGCPLCLCGLQHRLSQQKDFLHCCKQCLSLAYCPFAFISVKPVCVCKDINGLK